VHIFLSRPTWVSSEFEEGLNIFLMYLKNMGITPRTLGTTDYPSKAPLDEIIEIMEECQGAIVLGYPQIEVIEGNLKGNKISEKLILGTEWNRVEASLAYAKSLPLLIIHHETVSRGIFEKGIMNVFNHRVNLIKPSWCMDEGLNGALNGWKKNCDLGNANFLSLQTTDIDKPTCPTCSSAGKSVYLSELPKNFSLGNWRCSSCNYLVQ
jgi:hypothetical protein